MELKKAMNIRKSVRSYTGEPVSEEQLAQVLTAAYEAPVGMGKYDSIHFTVITDKDLLTEIDANGASFFGDPSIHPLYGAPMLIVLSSDSEGNVPSANVAMIIQNMSLAAVELGLGHCDIYGCTAGLCKNAELVKKLSLPEGFTPIASFILGPTEEVYTDREIPEEHKYSMNRI
jgi:FMN reductase (NADPH)